MAHQPLRLACFGLPLAAYLLSRDGHDVRLCVLAPVDAPGRRRLERTVGVERVLDARGLGERLEAVVETALARERPELIVSWFWTRRLPAAFLGAARLGGLGVHPSLLPRHRGPNPYFWAIDAGDIETGVTVHRLTDRYDDGPMLARRSLAVGDRDAWQLARALDRPSLAALREVVAAHARGAPPPDVPQDESAATWAPEPTGVLLQVDYRAPTERVVRRIRALAPSPGALLEVEGLELVVLRASATETFPRALEPGEAAVVGAPPRLLIRTGTTAVVIERGLLEAEGAGPALDGDAVGRLAEAHLRALGRTTGPRPGG